MTVPGLIAGSERIHIEGLEDEIARLRHGLVLIVRESEQFPGDDGIGAGTMARNLLAGDLTRVPVGDGTTNILLPRAKPMADREARRA